MILSRRVGVYDGLAKAGRRKEAQAASNRLVFVVRLAGLIEIFIGQIGWAVKLALRP